LIYPPPILAKRAEAGQLDLRREVVAVLTDQMNKLSDVQQIYESLDDNERFGIHVGLFPFRIKERMDQLGITPADLMKYDNIVRSRSGR
jgi:hypothetical protein